MSQKLDLYLLAIRGKLAPKTVEAARLVHNRTAGDPQSVAAARSLGDLVHMVYVPFGQPGPEASEFLILDQWNNPDGINQFFANHTVQEQAGEIFTERDPLVWKPAEGYISYHFPAPAVKKDRIIAMVRGVVRSPAEALQVHNALVGGAINQVRASGSMTHDAYFRLAAPGSPEALEFLAVDTWFDATGLQKIYADPNFMQGIQQMFTTQPISSIWVQPAGDWVEW